MTDEGMRGEPIDGIEALNAVKNTATLAWNLFEGLKEQGFETDQALKLTGAFLHGVGGGKLEQ